MLTKEKLIVYNWGEYMDPDVITLFEEETGIDVVYEEFETNEIMYPKISSGAIAYDLVCPSDYMIQRMRENDLLAEIKDRVARNERALVTTLTKKMAEDLTDYLLERGIKVEYLHSDVDTLRRVELLRELREGKIDVIVGINLLREGLDLPEVSLVAILDADKEGFLRSYRSLIQTIGRAARNVSGTVVMYADDITEAMRKAIDETNRRRDIQIAYNKEHGIDPKPLIKKISDVNDMLAKEDVDTQTLLGTGYRNADKAGNSHLGVPHTSKEESGRRHEEILKAGLPAQDLADLIRQLSEQMHTAAEQLQFELAARLRDEIRDLKKELRQMTEASK